VNVNIISIDVHIDILWIDKWHDNAISQGLVWEWKSNTDVHVVDINLNVSVLNEDPLLESEVSHSELCLQVINLKSEFILLFNYREDDIIGRLVNLKSVVVEVVLAINLNIWNLQIIQKIHDWIPVDILGLLKDRDFKWGFSTLANSIRGANTH